MRYLCLALLLFVACEDSNDIPEPDIQAEVSEVFAGEYEILNVAPLQIDTTGSVRVNAFRIFRIDAELITAIPDTINRTYVFAQYNLNDESQLLMHGQLFKFSNDGKIIFPTGVREFNEGIVKRDVVQEYAFFYRPSSDSLTLRFREDFSTYINQLDQ